MADTDESELVVSEIEERTYCHTCGEAYVGKECGKRQLHRRIERFRNTPRERSKPIPIQTSEIDVDRVLEDRVNLPSRMQNPILRGPRPPLRSRLSTALPRLECTAKPCMNWRTA